MSSIKKFLLAGASLLGSVAVASAADVAKPPVKLAPAPIIVPAPVWDGFVSAGWGHDSITTGSSSLSANRSTFRGSVETMVGAGFGVQADALAEHLDASSTSLNTAGGALHLFLRNPAWLLGGFVQYKNLAAGSSGNINEWYEGVEAQWLAPAMWSLYGRLAANQINQSTSSTSITGWDAHGEARFFVVPNWKVDVRAGYNTLGISGSTINTTMIGAGTEFRFAGPFSVFAEFEHLNATTSGSGGSATTNFWMVGAKVNVGTTTLQQRDKMGASLNPVESILLYIR